MRTQTEVRLVVFTLAVLCALGCVNDDPYVGKWERTHLDNVRVTQINEILGQQYLIIERINGRLRASILSKGGKMDGTSETGDVEELAGFIRIASAKSITEVRPKGRNTLEGEQMSRDAQGVTTRGLSVRYKRTR